MARKRSTQKPRMTPLEVAAAEGWTGEVYDAGVSVQVDPETGEARLVRMVSDDPLHELRMAVYQWQTWGDTVEDEAVAARRGGATWEEIGGVLGVTRQTAAATIGPLVDGEDS